MKMMASNMQTPRSKRNNNNGIDAWQDISLSPTASWSQPPAAMQLGEDEVSPTSVATSLFHRSNNNNKGSVFSFASPKANKLKSFFSPNANKYSPTSATTRQRYGYLHTEAKTSRRSQFVMAVGFLLMAYLGASSWTTLLAKSQDPLALSPPVNSLSGQAQAAFAKLYSRDFGATPSLWVVMEASPSKRFLATKLTSFDQLDSHSFTDDTSAVYSQGKEFAVGLADALVEQFNAGGAGTDEESSVQVTTYYSLQEQGLDYVGRNMVTPDGSKTMIQIQYLPGELGSSGIQKLKQAILDYGAANQPTYLDMHYTGQTWNPVQKGGNTGTLYGIFLLIVAIILVGGMLINKLGRHNAITQCYLLTVGSVAASLSASAIVLAYLVDTSATTPLALSATAMISFILSVYFSRAQVEAGNDPTQQVRTAMLQSGIVLFSACASLTTFSSPTLNSVSAATTITVATSVLFHVFLAPKLLKKIGIPSTPRKGYPSPSPSIQNDSKQRSIAVLLVTGLVVFSVACQSRRLPNLLMDGIAPTSFLAGVTQDDPFRTMGESMGHGRLSPYRILFDGHKRNQSMVSLAGYDIVQMLVDELVGISILDHGVEDVSDEPGVAGSTHIGEAFVEVQHLVKELVDTLREFKEEQEREFQLHHSKRKANWQKIQQDQQNHIYDEGEFFDVRCDYNVNSGLHATTYNGIAVLENKRIPQSLYSSANICRGIAPRCPSEALHLLNVVRDITTTPDSLATYVNVNLGVDPFSWKGIEWLRRARATVRRLQEDPRILGGVEIHIDGPAAVVEDLYSSEHRGMQFKLFRAFGIVLAVLGILFRSVVVPLRIVANLTLVLAFTLGVGSLVYKSARDVEGGGLTAFPETMICLLTITAVLASNVLSTKLNKSQGGLVSAPVILAGGFLILEMLVSSSTSATAQWPLMVAAGVIFEGVWIRRFVLPALSEVWPKASKNHLGGTETRFFGVSAEESSKRNACMEKV